MIFAYGALGIKYIPMAPVPAIADSNGGKTDKRGSIGTILVGGFTTLGDSAIFGSGGTIRCGIQIRIVIYK